MYNEFVENAEDIREEGQTEGQDESSESPEPQEQDPNELIRALETDVDAERKRNDLLMQHILRRESKPQEPQKNLFDEYGLSPDDYLNRKQLEEIFAHKDSEFKGQLRELRGYYNEQVAIAKHPDFEDVVLNLTRDLCDQRPDLLKAIAEADNDAEMAYQIGITHPLYQEYLRETQQQSTVQKIRSNLKKPGTLSQASQRGYSGKDDLERVRNMSDEDIDKAYHKLTGTRLGG